MSPLFGPKNLQGGLEWVCITERGCAMSYMGYYFYPDALESIHDNVVVGKKHPSPSPFFA